MIWAWVSKTVSTLTAIDELMFDRFLVQRVLVIAPKRVAETTWTDEAAEWEHTAGLRLSVVLGSQQDRLAALSRKADIYVINRENVVWLVEHFGRAWPFDMIVIDEASSFKNHQAKRFKALRKVRPLASRIVELTGTPAPNGLLDLWAQLYLLDRGERLEKSITRYRDRYFEPDKRDGHIVYSWKLKPGAADAIYEKIGDICVSMKSEDYIQLPPVILNTVPVMLDAAAKRKYDELERDLVLNIEEKDILANTAAALSGKLLQMANGAVYAEEREVVHIHDAKLEALAEIIDCNAGKSVMVFYYFKHDLQRLKERFPDARELKTADDIHGWNAGKIPLLLVHPASAGHGLNLQHGGHIVVWFGLTWSLEMYQQANKRLHRSGQTEPVIIHHLVARGTVDEDVMRALRNKGNSQDAMLDAVKARIKKYRGA